MTRPAHRITDLDVAAYTVPTDQPEADGTLAWHSTTIVVVHATAGQVGGIGWTYAPPSCAQVVRDLLAPAVIDRGVLDVGGSWQAMVRAVRNAGRAGLVGYAISAVDTALWDLKARMLDLPLHRLLGAVRDEVPIYGSGGFTTYDEQALADQLEGWVGGSGIPRVKIKIGQAWGTQVERDLDRVAQARSMVGPGVELFVDANGAYRAKQAIRVAQRLTEHGVTWFEEPVSSEDLDGLRTVRQAVAPDVTAGEYGGHLTYFARMCAAQAVDCLQVDVSRCGGITEWLRVAALAAAHHLEVSGHCAPHLHLHVAAATPNLRHLEWFHDHTRIETRFFAGACTPAGGVLVPDDHAPGNGLSLRHADSDPFRVG